MRINTNLAALNAWRNLTFNSLNMQKSLEKLSSGYRINRAADDAAGLAVSEKMRAQIRGTNQAIKNAQDGISLLQTAEGALTEVHAMLQRMRELAVQASTSTLQDPDRALLQEEFAQLQQEITRIAEATQFNGKNLLDGSAGVSVTTNSSEVSNLSANGDTQAGSYNVNGITAGKKAVLYVKDWDSTTNQAADFGGNNSVLQSDLNLTVNGKSYSFAKDTKVQDVLDTINADTATTGAVAKYDATSNSIKLESSAVGSAQKLDVTAGNAVVDADGTLGGAVNTLNATGLDASISDIDLSSVNYEAVGNRITILSGNAKGLSFTVSDTANNITATINVGTNGSITIQTGAESGQGMNISINDMRASALNIDSLSISTQSGASSALDALDNAINTVSTQRAKLGAFQNRLEYTVSSLSTTSENLSAAESRIRDVDMAMEMATFTKFQILQQASTAMLAQANQSTQAILSLLR